ncbi:NAD-dependent deacetylase [Paraburkholderia sp. UCT31]|uniref:SIR2 family NAD-dependent protein deacylase n=1 Tax=Paraburkholderia sp. UCT31 TaxID=2615209 RepID=UPI0016553338|nr:Sir2 family NAD-dependent protein deacetylase [Paraburkholderia sp. UCT31]MBC8736307.1 NAD-dependent deacetylase [Paraburkholderia sp. UCT31]
MDTAEQMTIAADWIREADGILITAGAGMGVDSGLPDFRGDHGFWAAYPALKTGGINFHDIANGTAFLRDPVRAWGFYGHRLNLYRRTVPHAGFEILRRWASAKRSGGFVFTSNVDGQFQKAGFADDRLFECHGSIHFLQCGQSCTHQMWSADGFQPEVDVNRCALLSPLPKCPNCGCVARPAILMFDDWHWVETRTRHQRMRYEAWLLSVEQAVVIEIGAGRAIPTVRDQSERFGPRVVRINPRECAVDPRIGLGLAGRALDVLRSLNKRMG